MTRAARYKQELLENIIPFWMKHSIDPEHGGFWTCLDRQGNLYDDRKYVWLNGRQVWTLSKLYNTVERRQEWLDAAQKGAAFLRKHVYDEQGRCYFALNRDGSPAAYQRKPYGALFVMLGFLELSKATGDESFRAEALNLFEKMQRWIADPTLLGRPGKLPSQLADIYAMAFMSLELGQSYQPVNINAHIQKGVLLETAAPLSTPEGRLFCPGSSFEIAWILMRLNPEPWHLDVIEATMQHWDNGFPYFIDIEGHPTFQLEHSQRLWWVHVEALIALAQAYKHTGDAKWLKWFDQVDAWTWKHLRDPDYGEWYGYLDKHGNPELTCKGNHYKGCFHIPRALLYCSQLLE